MCESHEIAIYSLHLYLGSTTGEKYTAHRFHIQADSSVRLWQPLSKASTLSIILVYTIYVNQ